MVPVSGSLPVGEFGRFSRPSWLTARMAPGAWAGRRRLRERFGVTDVLGRCLGAHGIPAGLGGGGLLFALFPPIT